MSSGGPSHASHQQQSSASQPPVPKWREVEEILQDEKQFIQLSSMKLEKLVTSLIRSLCFIFYLSWLEEPVFTFGDKSKIQRARMIEFQRAPGELHVVEIFKIYSQLPSILHQMSALASSNPQVQKTVREDAVARQPGAMFQFLKAVPGRVAKPGKTGCYFQKFETPSQFQTALANLGGAFLQFWLNFFSRSREILGRFEKQNTVSNVQFKWGELEAFAVQNLWPEASTLTHPSDVIVRVLDYACEAYRTFIPAMMAESRALATEQAARSNQSSGDLSNQGGARVPLIKGEEDELSLQDIKPYIAPDNGREERDAGGSSTTERQLGHRTMTARQWRRYFGQFA
ncbi:hypothetical protein T439DRAFT_330958 [Meredithblackwellia eburnea MCA 4105]